MALNIRTGRMPADAMTGLFDIPPVLNLSTLFRELPLLERPHAARDAGYEEVELWWPWEDSPAPTDRQVDDLVAAVESAGVHLTGLNLFAGNLSGPDAGILSLPNREREFFDNLDVALALGERLGIEGFNTLYGNRVETSAPQHQDALAVERLTVASARAEAQGACLYLEPLSGPKPYPLRTGADALAVVDTVLAHRGLDPGTSPTAAGVGWLCDLYHLAANGLSPQEVLTFLTAHGARAAHVQVADAPGRGVPGSGGLPLAAELVELRTAGYRGRVALEFIPADGTSTREALEGMTFAR